MWCVVPCNDDISSPVVVLSSGVVRNETMHQYRMETAGLSFCVLWYLKIMKNT